MSRPLPGPVGARVIEALARRADAQQGEARERILQCIAAWRTRQAEPPEAGHAGHVSPARGDALAGLSALVDRLGRGAEGDPTAPESTRAGPASPAPLKAVVAFQGTWARLRADQRLREALAQVPAQAGPLNSSHVVHRALQELHTLSPAYLDAFLRQLDTLAWLERARAQPAPRSR